MGLIYLRYVLSKRPGNACPKFVRNEIKVTRSEKIKHPLFLPVMHHVYISRHVSPNNLSRTLIRKHGMCGCRHVFKLLFIRKQLHHIDLDHVRLLIFHTWCRNQTRTRIIGSPSGNHIHQTTDVTLPNSRFFD